MACPNLARPVHQLARPGESALGKQPNLPLAVADSRGVGIAPHSTSGKGTRDEADVAALAAAQTRQTNDISL